MALFPDLTPEESALISKKHLEEKIGFESLNTGEEKWI